MYTWIFHSRVYYLGGYFNFPDKPVRTQSNSLKLYNAKQAEVSKPMVRYLATKLTDMAEVFEELPAEGHITNLATRPQFSQLEKCRTR